jgi:hypothetical protein
MVLPYLKGLVIIKLWFSIWFHRSCVVIVFRYLWIYCDILYSAIWFLTHRLGAENMYLGKNLGYKEFFGFS